MAKRTEEDPFRPLQHSLINSVIRGGQADERAGEPVLRPTAVVAVPELAVRERSPRQPRDEPPSPAPVALRPQPAQRLDREKRVLLSATEERAVERVIANLGAELGTSLKLSHVLRSSLLLLLHCERELLERARANGPIVRPPNGDAPGLNRFEREVAAVLAAAFRDGGAPR